MIYVSGETISVDLDQQLLKEGYNIKRIINYRTVHNENFNNKFVVVSELLFLFSKL